MSGYTGTMNAGAITRRETRGIPGHATKGCRMFHRRLPWAVLVTAAAVTTATACSSLNAAGSSRAATGSGQTATTTTMAASSSDFALHALPGGGMSWFYSQINGARSSIDLTMYELQDTTAEKDLASAEAAGVKVRVILDGYEKSANSGAYNYLSGHNVGVVWSWDKYYYTHEKCMVVDGRTADIMTLNLQSQYYSTTRDFAVVDTDASDVSAIVNVFNHDYAHTSVTPGAGADLVWSPTTSQAKLTALINGAKSSIRIYSEEMDDPTVTSDLVSAAKRGVKVQVVGENEDGEYDSEYQQLYDAGVQISYFSSSTGFYIHGKVIMTDYGTSGSKIFIGSQNFSNTSLNDNRELGLIISDSSLETNVNGDFTNDFAKGKRFT